MKLIDQIEIRQISKPEEEKYAWNREEYILSIKIKRSIKVISPGISFEIIWWNTIAQSLQHLEVLHSFIQLTVSGCNEEGTSVHFNDM